MSGTTHVILANLGAPGTLDEVRPFLKNLFSDPDIFHFPFGSLGQSVFSSMLAGFRAPKSRKNYAAIGGGSPLHKNTLDQVEKLRAALGDSGEYKVIAAQRYWHPLIADVAKQLRRDNCRKIILIPLYPHYSTTSTLSIVKEWQSQAKGLPKPIVIERFYAEPDYIKACALRIVEKLPAFSEPPHILFSAHSIPVQRVKDGDPYDNEIRKNMEMIMDQLGRNYSYSLAYQSKVGPVKWLEPTVEMEIDRLVGEGKKRLLVFPISFVSEHLETLYELDIQKKTYAMANGISQYERANTVQDDDNFINMLASLVREYAS